MGYKQTHACLKRKNIAIIAQSLKTPCFALLGYAASKKATWMQGGFYDLLNNGVPSNAALYLAIGFWTASMVFPGVAHAYFGTERFACNGDTEIVLHEVSALDPAGSA